MTPENSQADFTPNQAIATTGLPRGLVWAALRRGSLPSYLISDRVRRIRRGDLEAWLATRSQGLGIEEVMGVLCASRSTVIRLISDGSLKTHERRGRRVRVTHESLEALRQPKA